MVTAGALHFLATDAYVAIMPSYLPWHRELVYVSGVFEILGGLGLLVPRWRRAAGLGLIALFVAVFPANINMAVNNIQPSGLSIPEALLWARLPFQGVFIAWAWWVSQPDGPRLDNDKVVGGKLLGRDAEQGDAVTAAEIDH